MRFYYSRKMFRCWMYWAVLLRDPAWLFWHFKSGICSYCRTNHRCKTLLCHRIILILRSFSSLSTLIFTESWIHTGHNQSNSIWNYWVVYVRSPVGHSVETFSKIKYGIVERANNKMGTKESNNMITGWKSLPSNWVPNLKCQQWIQPFRIKASCQ